MRSNFKLLLLLSVMASSIHAQNEKSTTLNIGDPAPPLRVREWIKGKPVERFEKGRIYVVEFWATWCAPCRAAMPRLSALARQYKDSVTILGIDVMEMKTTSMQKIKAFVDSMGQRMDYCVAAEDSNFMETDWLDASGEHGIPTTFVVNAEGRLAWMGHPSHLEGVLAKIVNNSWDIKEALAKRNSDKYLEKLDWKASNELHNLDLKKLGDLGKPDSALLVINEIVRKEPKLKYAPRIAYYTFSSLLKTNPHKAYEYGKVAMVTSTYQYPPYDAIINPISVYSGQLNLPPAIYQLGAEAYQAQIDLIPYPEIANMPKYYNEMAEWYWRANDKSKAIEAQQKAIEAMKSKHATEMAELESRLQKYMKM